MKRLPSKVNHWLRTMSLTLPILTVLAGCQSLISTQRQALVDIYRSTGGENWSYSDGWMSNQSICTWHGITCADEQVIGLNLASNNLKGDLPPEIGQLTGLQELNLEDNLLSELPPEIGQLSGLQTLNLGSNQLTGLPPEIGQLTGLRTLDLSNNYLKELPREIDQLSSLQILDLSCNQLAELPQEFDQLSGLQVLILRSNRLDGSSLPPFTQMDGLQVLDLSYNHFVELPQQLYGRVILDAHNAIETLEMDSLQVLDLSGNPIEEPLPQRICRGLPILPAGLCEE